MPHFSAKAVRCRLLAGAPAAKVMGVRSELVAKVYKTITERHKRILIKSGVTDFVCARACLGMLNVALSFRVELLRLS